MEELTTTEAREQLADIVNRAAYGKERVILTRRGKPVVGIVPMEDMQLLEALETERDTEEARAGLAEAGAGDTIPWADSKARRRRASTG